MRTIFSLTLACTALGFLLPSLHGAEPSDEQQFVRVLQSNASLQDKDAACALLKKVGTVRSVEALSQLLPDEQLSHSARYVLESMSAPEAGKALLAALSRTSGLTKAGIIGSLGVRREQAAVPALVKLLRDPDSGLSTAAARALGRIAGNKAAKGLQDACKLATGATRDAVEDALLANGYGFLREGQPGKATKLFRFVFETGSNDSSRAAGYRGLIAASGQESIALVKEGLLSDGGPRQLAALQSVHELSIPGATEAICDVLAKVPAPLQAAIIGGLSQRGDTSAAAPIASILAASRAPEVRAAAADALGLLGNESSVRVLTEAAAGGGPEQAAARQALAVLRGKEISAALASLLAATDPTVRAEAARALGERGDATAIPKLLELANQGQNSAALAALDALSALGSEKTVPALVGLVKTADGPEKRARASESLNTVLQKVLKTRGSVDPTPLLSELGAASVEARVALLSVCSGLADERVREALRGRFSDPDAQIRSAAIRAACDSVDPRLLPDLLGLARQATEENVRVLAKRASVRLIKEDETATLNNAQKLSALKSLLDGQPTAEETRIVLGGLAEIPEIGSLQLAEPFLEQPALQAEAARATVKVASALPDATAAAAALKKVLAASNDAAIRETAAAALKAVEAKQDYITAWQVAGPYRENGKNYSALFDAPFPPEQPGAKPAEWRTLPSSPDPKRPWSMDLLAALGGEQAVAYARTWIFSEQASPAVLELGSDDGAKVWLNEKLVHANNTARALIPGQDKVNVALQAGWNSLLLKVTQNNLGWEFSVRFLKPDGSRIEGLRADPAHSPSR